MSRTWWPAFNSKRTPKRPLARPTLVSLEDRCTPAVTATLVADVLTVTTDKAAETAFLRVDVDGKIEVATDNAFALPVGASPFAGVNKIVVTDTGAKSSQSVTFTGVNPFNLSSGLETNQIELVTLIQTVNATGGVNINDGLIFTANSIAAGASDIVVISDEIDLAGGAKSVATTGTITLQPSTVVSNVELGAAANNPLALSLTSTDLAAINPTASKLIFGSVAGTGILSIAAPLTFSTDVALLNEGVGGIIGLTESISVGAKLLQINSGDTITQTVGTITAGNLQFSALGTVSLGNANSVAKLSGSATGFTYSGSSVIVNGVDSSVAGFVSITSTGTLTVSGAITAFDDVTLTTTDAVGPGQDITIDSGVTVRSTADNVFLNAGDSLTIAGTVKSDVGNVAMIVDEGNADAGVGASAFISKGTYIGATITLNGDIDSDTFYSGSGSSNVVINGKDPVAPASPGDTLVIDFGATNVTAELVGTAYTFNGSTFTATNIETYSVLTTGKLTVLGTAGNDAFILDHSGTNNRFTINTGPAFNFTASTLAFTGLDGNDKLTVSYAGGNPLTVGGVTFDGGNNSDTLIVRGSNTQKAIYTPSATTTGNGTVTVDGQAINFVGLAPVDLFLMNNVTLALPAAGNDITVQKGLDFGTGSKQALIVSGKTNGKAVDIESLAVWSTATFVIDTTVGDGNDLVTVQDATNAHKVTNFTIDTGKGTDTAIFTNNATFTGTVSASSGKTVEITSGKTLTANQVSLAVDTAGAIGGVANLVGADIVAGTATLTGGSAKDTFNLSGYTAAMSINADGNTDTLNFNGSAGNVVVNGSSITAAGKAAVTQTSIETLNISNANNVSFTGTTATYSESVIVNAKSTVVNDNVSVNGGTLSFTNTTGFETGSSSLVGKTLSVLGAGPMTIRDGKTTSVSTTGIATFATTVDGPGSLIVTATGDTTFSKAVGNTTNALQAFTSNGGGKTVISGGSLKTSGAIVIDDDVTVDTLATTIQSANGPMIFNGSVTLTKASTVQTTSGPITFNGLVTINDASTIKTTNGDIAFNNNLLVNKASTIQTDIGSISVVGTVTLNEATTLQTNVGGITFNDLVTINKASKIQTTNGQIDFNGNLLVAEASTVKTDTGNINFNATSTFNDTTTISAITGAVSFNDTVTINKASTVQTTNGDINFNAFLKLNADATAKTLTTGKATFGTAVDGPANLTVDAKSGTTFLGAVGLGAKLASLTSGDSTTIVGGQISTTGAQTYNGATFIALDTSFITDGGNVLFSGGLNSTTDGFSKATINTGVGTVTFTGATNPTSRANQIFVTAKSAALNGIVLAKTDASFTVTNGVTQAAGGTGVSASRITLAGGGTFDLGSADTKNDAGKAGLVINLTTPGTVTFRDIDSLNVDSTGGGIRTVNGNVTLIAGNDIVVQDQRPDGTRYTTPIVDIGTGNFRLFPGQTRSSAIIFDAEAKANNVSIGDAGVTFPNKFADVFSIRPSATVEITVNGNLPTGLPGDRLSVISQGAVGLSLTQLNATDGKYTFGNRKTVTYTGIDEIGGIAVDAFAIQITNSTNPNGVNEYVLRVLTSVQGVQQSAGFTGAGLPGNTFVVSPRYRDVSSPYFPPQITFGDINGDGTQDIILANGTDSSPLVTVLNGATVLKFDTNADPTNLAALKPEDILAQFYAFEPSFYGGISAAAADINGDGKDEVIVGAGPGGGPRVRVLSFNGASPDPYQRMSPIADFFAYEDTFRGGVNVASGLINADGKADLVIGTGVGGGPRVRVLDGGNIATKQLAYKGNQAGDVINDFFAFEQTFRGGVYVAAGNYNSDGRADIAMGPGYGGGPRVRVLDGAALVANVQTTLADFIAFPESNQLISGDNPFFTGVGGLAFGRLATGSTIQQQLLVASTRGRVVSAKAFDHDTVTGAITTSTNLATSPEFLPSGSKSAINPDVRLLRDAVSVGGFASEILGSGGILGGILLDDRLDF